MILDFKITNYKSFQNETNFTMVSEASKLKSSNVHRMRNHIGELFRTSKVSVIYGANASGKSNLLLALTDLVSYIVNKPAVGEDARIHNPFSFDVVDSRKPTKYNIVFLGPNDIRYDYTVVVAGTKIVEEKLKYYPEKRPRRIFSRKSTIKAENESSDYNKIEVEEYTIDRKTYSIFSNQLLLSKFGEEPHEILSKVYVYFRDKFNLEVCRSNYSDTLRDNAARMLLNDSSLEENVKRLFQVADTKILDFFIEEEEDKNTSRYFNTITGKSVMQDSLYYTKKKIQVNFMHQLYDNGMKFENAAVLLSHDQESRGTQTLFTIGTNIFSALEKGHILIVDELDSSLHPYITRLLVQLFLSDFFNKNGAQLIFNTHDVTLLDEELFRKDQIWITEKNEMGVSELFSLSDFEGLREDTPFEKWYMAGKFGGLPNISNLEKIFSE